MQKLTVVITSCIALSAFVSAGMAQEKRKLVWSDEFNYTGLPDSAKWSYNVGGNGWGNQELQYYTSKKPSNARVENGSLVIEARKETVDK